MAKAEDFDSGRDESDEEEWNKQYIIIIIYELIAMKVARISEI